MEEKGVVKGFKFVGMRAGLLELGKRVGGIEVIVRLDKGRVYDITFEFPQGVPEEAEKAMMFIARTVGWDPKKFEDEGRVTIWVTATTRITLDDFLDSWDQWERVIIHFSRR